ncbi:cholesterol 25-hydroxylase-like [Mizuhopecten yessoensis]|uniref:Cholesterol 25-hydroxylase-like protein n=1 Tax=Mizuhopecten yessoensis TaxID=6573 RepID=A0A210QC72_MIZYE|nr:cholesterol 25-hydroxylase-like [Mizuhopecten yessoensis]XP_021361976.1 cholesterol 25-hydroxylase-like [Mizuhopecten yessoensis]XP_021361977.1 cholesterol 25-hydroxylase-like [Mizuhopecten yessoensis]XP_021361978.1 cholesterol 25-hydroxylase-like [Mizuhopecten yessoensis]OWF46328.1 Cholesterol 25-hydroxylase-like protein [Mizuhopecten yessoensis]
MEKKELASRESMAEVKTRPLEGWDRCVPWIMRAVILLVVIVLKQNSDTIQKWIDSTWSDLLTSWVFNSVYFESWHATLTYAIVIPIYPFALHYIPYFDRYKVHPSVTYVHTTGKDLLMEAVTYLTPLMLLDTFTIKKYVGVHPSVMAQKRLSFIQTTRPLPIAPPTVGQVGFQLISSVLLFDFMFFCFHLLFHKNAWLYKTVHALHHKHDVMHGRVTNLLTVPERIVLILSANYALRFMGSHPITRMLFVPVFIFLLVDNHTGYDLPFGIHRIVPFNLMGGPAAHMAHHFKGTTHYQPFFTYMDTLLGKYNSYSSNVGKKVKENKID